MRTNKALDIIMAHAEKAYNRPTTAHCCGVVYDQIHRNGAEYKVYVERVNDSDKPEPCLICGHITNHKENSIS